VPTPSAPPEPPDPLAVARFAHDVVRTAPWLDDAKPVVVAVSGGSDSLALLALAHAHWGPVRCLAATVDHGLRSASAQEALTVARLCATLGIGHAILIGPLPDRAAGTANVSQRARTLRYDRLMAHASAVGAAAVLTAHHADDQLETLVMRLNRGSGLAGLSGIRAVNGNVVRPLLGWTRAELAVITRDCGLRPVDDPANADDRYDRARLRKVLATTSLFDVAAVARSVAALGEAEAALDAVATTRCAELPGDGTVTPLDLDLRDLPVDLIRRISLRCVARLDPAARPRRSTIERLGRLQPGEKLSIGDVVVAFERVPVDGSGEVFWPIYRFALAPARRPTRNAAHN